MGYEKSNGVGYFQWPHWISQEGPKVQLEKLWGVKDEWQELDNKGPDVKQGSSARVRDLAKDEGQGGRH